MFSKGCKVLYSNVDSIHNKKEEILTRVEKLKPKIIAFTETQPKTGNNKDIKPFDIPNYEKFCNDNPKRGVVIYIDNLLNARSVENLNSHLFEESTWCSFVSNDKEQVLLGCLYRSPSSSELNYNRLKDLLTSDLIQKYDRICIMGDFNFPNISWDCTDINGDTDFVDCIRDAYLIQKVNKPTRDRESQKSNLLDLILVNDDNFSSDVEHLDPFGKSDHQALTFDLDVNTNITRQANSYTFNLAKGNYNKMREITKNLDWTHLDDLNINQMWNEIKSGVKLAMETCIPKKKIIKSKRIQPSWMSNKALRKIKKKYKLFKRFLKTKNGYDYLKYIEMRNSCKKEIRKAKRRHEKRIADDCKNNPKSFWKYVHEQTKSKQGIGTLKDKDGNLITTEVDKANTLNDFFASVYTKEDCENIPDLKENSKSKGLSIPEVRVTPLVVENKLKELDASKAQGPDGIPPRVLKELYKELAIPICILFNKSLESGTIPDEWKTAEVTAIFKKGSKSDPGNYRPVSLTCVLCKILESIIRDIVVNHFTENSLYAKCQHGFRKKRSCITQLLEVMEDFTLYMQSKNSFDIVYLDFRKAFDTVPHQRLLTKLKAYGITGKLHTWIENFLIGRSQKVKINSYLSAKTDVHSGIPQGSILGPILFTIFINDLPEGIKSTCKIFADDTKIYNSSDNSSDIQEDIQHLENWSNTWKLYFNVSKCKVMHLGLDIDRQRQPYYMHNNGQTNRIDTCDQEKDLGVTFDEKLLFYKHINNVISKANQMLGLIKRSFSYMNKHIFLKLYKSLVRPHLEYGNIIWHPLFKKQSIAIERVQRRATLLLKECKSMSYMERLKYLDLYSLKGRRLRGDLIETYKIFNGLSDLDPSKFFMPPTLETTRNSDKKIFIQDHKGKHRTNYYSIRIAPHWNALTNTFRSAKTTNTFKNLLDSDMILKESFFEFDGEA